MNDFYLNRSIFKDFIFNGIFTMRNTISINTMDFIFIVSSPWFRVTLLNTFGSGLTFSTRFVFSSCMMVTNREWIRSTPLMISILISSYKTRALKVFPCTRWEPTITSHTTSETTATNEIFSWNSRLILLVFSNTQSITHSFSSSKCPTRSTSWLISNFFNAFTSRPLFSRIKRFRNILKSIFLFNG